MNKLSLPPGLINYDMAKNFLNLVPDRELTEENFNGLSRVEMEFLANARAYVQMLVQSVDHACSELDEALASGDF